MHLHPAVLPTLRSISTGINSHTGDKKVMRKNLISAIVGGAILVASSMASAHVDVGIGIGIPGPVFIPAQPVYEAPPPIVYAPAPVAAYGYPEDWRERDWHERQEWRERQWRHHEHERERRERRGWDED